MTMLETKKKWGVFVINHNAENALRSNRVYQAYKVFFEAMKTDDIHELVRKAGDFLECGILLTDENYYLVSQYPNKKIGEDVWDTLHEHKALPYEVIKSFQEMYLKNKRKTYKPFYADWGLVGSYPRIFAEIYNEDRILGHIGIFLMGKKLKDDDLEVTQILVDALVMKMSTPSGYMPTLATYFSDLLRSDTDLYLRDWAAKTIAQSVERSYVIMVTPIGHSAAQEAFAQYSVSQVSRVYRNAVSTIYNNSIVSLFGEMGSSSKGDQEKAFLNQAAEFLTKLHAVSGVSEVFDDLLQTPEHYQQAMLTSMLSHERTAFYRDLAPAPMYFYIAQNSDVRAFIHPVLFQISEYDSLNGSQYFVSLKNYCLAMHNMESASKALFIHRNTLSYRLKRIEELFGIAFEDRQLSRYLISSFELWDVYT